MVQCCVLGCQNRTEQGISDVTFHRFPSSAGLVEIWIEACGRYDWRPTRYSRICSNHFMRDLIIRRGNKTFLKPGALPTNNIHTTDLSSRPGCSKSSETQSDIFEKPIETQASTKGSRKRKVEVETPRKKKLRKIADNRLKKLRAVRQAKRRLLKRNAELSHIVAELRMKSLLSYEDAEFLNSIDTVSRDFLRRFIGIESKNTRYSPSLRKFALCLHFLSPRAYSYLREQFNTCLPHPQTLTNWYRSVDGSPGFTKESLEAIKLKTKLTDKKIYVSVSFDEMAIRKCVTFSEGEFFGTVNIGSSLYSDDARLAKQSLVFMATAINDSWKIPVDYFLIDSLSGEQKAELTKSCVQLLTQSGVEVVSVTCDGCPSNFAMAKILGCKIDCNNPKEIRTDFKVDVDGNQKTIVFYPDPPHMLKLLRNILGDKCMILDSEGDIKWEFIKKMHNLQDTEGLHLGSKLRKAHVDFSKQIMKVKLAAQTLSNSVADAIDFCRCELKLLEFLNSAEQKFSSF